MNPPTIAQALGQGIRAVRQSIWLVPAAFGAAMAARLAGAAAPFFAGAVAVRGFQSAGEGNGRAALAAALVALLNARVLCIWLGLALAALLLRGAVRVLWLAGALPTLGEALSGRGAPAFAAGATWGYPRTLGTALLGFLLELGASAVATAALLAASAVTARFAGAGDHTGGALLVALALTAAAILPLLAGALADAALARSALRGEPPRRAFVAAAVRLGDRPIAYLAVAMTVGLAGAVVVGSANAITGTALQLASLQVPAALLATPRLLVMALGALLGAVFELWRMGATAVLACHATPGDDGR